MRTPTAGSETALNRSRRTRSLLALLFRMWSWLTHLTDRMALSSTRSRSPSCPDGRPRGRPTRWKRSRVSTSRGIPNLPAPPVGAPPDPTQLAQFDTSGLPAVNLATFWSNMPIQRVSAARNGNWVYSNQYSEQDYYMCGPAAGMSVLDSWFPTDRWYSQWDIKYWMNTTTNGTNWAGGSNTNIPNRTNYPMSDGLNYYIYGSGQGFYVPVPLQFTPSSADVNRSKTTCQRTSTQAPRLRPTPGRSATVHTLTAIPTCRSSTGSPSMGTALPGERPSTMTRHPEGPTSRGAVRFRPSPRSVAAPWSRSWGTRIRLVARVAACVAALLITSCSERPGANVHPSPSPSSATPLRPQRDRKPHA